MKMRIIASISFMFLSSTGFADDGHGLPSKPPQIDKKTLDAIYAEGKTQCKNSCVTPFGKTLGKADGVEAKSNCKSECIASEYLFWNAKKRNFSVLKDDPKKKDVVYVGMIYQCIEFARKWLIKNMGTTFGSVDGANEIIYLNEGIKISDNSTFKLERSVNGTAKREPKRGDLVVYQADTSQKEWRFGHVAVVANSNPKLGTVDLVEENYDNKPWRSKSYARKIKLQRNENGYTLHDIEISNPQKPVDGGGKIMGWIYPAQ